MSLGLSTRNRKSTHPPKPPRLTQKPTDPPMTVDCESLPRKTDLGGLDGGLSSPKPDEPDPTDVTRERRSDLPRSTQIRWRFGSFWLDPAIRWKFSLKSGLEVVFFASILWLSHRSEEKSTDPAKIRRWNGSSRSNLGLRWSFLLRSRGCHINPKKNQQIQWRFGEIRWRFGDFRWRFSENLEVETHSDFNRPDRCPPEPDLTRPKVVGDRRRVVQPPTQCERVGSG